MLAVPYRSVNAARLLGITRPQIAYRIKKMETE